MARTRRTDNTKRSHRGETGVRGRGRAPWGMDALQKNSMIEHKDIASQLFGRKFRGIHLWTQRTGGLSGIHHEEQSVRVPSPRAQSACSSKKQRGTTDLCIRRGEKHKGKGKQEDG